MEMHYNDEFAIDALEKYAGDVYQYQGFPYCRYSLAEGSGDRAVNDIQALVEKQLVEYPAQTAIKASSSISGNTLKVDASVTASSKGTFDLGMAVLKDNCIPASSEAYETVYNDVVLSISGNYYGMSADGSFTLEADDLSFYSIEKNGWVAEAGEFQALIGPSSVDIRTTAAFELK